VTDETAILIMNLLAFTRNRPILKALDLPLQVPMSLSLKNIGDELKQNRDQKDAKQKKHGI